ncbi:MAG: DUF2161 family putative PD-(D/E)XK-type phosphodiesterase [Acholeplasma sp.]|jgi:hypothetical protein|nr:DUF2161 family putative PD-(D/E)XK-type phosphodiesterase [Acholeplasma sp.]
MTITKETDLYDPCKTLLESLGYQVKAEVGAIDIMAIKDDYMVIVELKLKISLKLIYQAIDRQKLADKVYIALPKTVLNQTKSNVKHFLNLLKRLEIGLIVVSNNQADVLVETFGFDLKRSITASKKKKEKLMKEFALRKSDINVGGTKSKKMTHYKEKVIEIAKYLREFGQKSPKEIVLYTGIKDTPNILRKNYYMWFINVERGIYQLSEIGKKALDELTE